MSYLGFRSIATHIKTIVTDLINENKSSTIVTSFCCMGFFSHSMHRILGTVFHRNKIAINFRSENRLNIDVLISEMNCWPNFKSFRPKKSQNRTNIGEVQKFFHFSSIFIFVWRT